MLGTKLEAITLADIQEFASEEIPEGKSLEYKGSFYRLDSGTDKQKRDQYEELFKDISSFANTLGGDLLIGVSETKGVPKEVCGFETDNPDKLKLRILELVQNWIEPRIAISIHSVVHSPGRYVFIIRVVQSTIGPHRVIYKNEFGQFYARSSAGVFAMDTAELRQAFTLTETLTARIKAFRAERVKMIEAGEGPIILTGGAKLIVHLIPIDSLASKINFSPSDLEDHYLQFPVMGSDGALTTRYNLDGTAVFDNPYPGRPSSRYVQLFRNGIVESVIDEAIFSHPNDAEQVRYFEPKLVKSVIAVVRSYASVLKEMGVSPPLWCFLTLTKAKNFNIWTPSIRMKYPCDRDVVSVQEVQLTDFEIDNYPTALRPMFDSLWNAAGHSRCHAYNEAGRFVGVK